MTKYNYALIPEDTQKFIDFSLKISVQEKLIGKYQLHQNSIPHITLCHFEMSKNQVENVWEDLKKNRHLESISLTFNILNSCHHKGKYWYLLIPNETNLLTELHKNSLTTLKISQNLNKKYYPHLTLFNILKTHKKDLALHLQTPFKDNFFFSITDRDDVGQSKNILFK